VRRQAKRDAALKSAGGTESTIRRRKPQNFLASRVSNISDLRSAFLTTVVLLTKAVDEGGPEPFRHDGTVKVRNHLDLLGG
jgi:hypothetical protein